MAAPASSGYHFVPTLHDDIYPAINPTKNNLSQPSKVVFITGAGRGIGRSIALQYAYGGVACVILCARTSADLDEVERAIHAINNVVRVRKLVLDVTDEAKVREAAAAVKAEEGRLDVLVNNAGTGDKWTPICDGVTDEYWNTWMVNYKGTYLMVKAFLPLLVQTAKEQDTVVDLVNMSSIGARVVIPGASGYQVSKLAVCRFTEFIAVEYGGQGVNCMAVHPGSVHTDLSKGLPEQFLAFLTDKPELCGGFVVWLTKGKRTWLGGRYLSATWDVEELEAKKDEIVKGKKLKVRLVI